jgi:hypothetical protein
MRVRSAAEKAAEPAAFLKFQFAAIDVKNARFPGDLGL